MRTREMQDQKYEVFLTVCLGILRALVAMTRAKKQISFIIANDKNIADLVVYKFFLSLLINITVLNI
ncbi:hypothetical protein T05_12123 [Trichinella murrelli]|uniref:Uncharacterized protein n=1 Tax=Trichinella murrelli TaxID=144512 RepID=A0A0V0TBC4_9BILA|nr:hypothetical protein T05_12123 [Trichinella murrelli]